MDNNWIGPMHIGFVTPEYPSANKPQGGLGNYIRKTGSELVKRGHQVTVFVLGHEVGESIDVGVKVINVRKTKTPWRLKQNKSLGQWLGLYEHWANNIKLSKLIKVFHGNIPFDVLQVPNYQYLGIAICKNDLFPVICRCSSYSALWRSANGRVSSLVDVISDWLEARQVRDADAAFAPSKLIAEVYERFESVRVDVLRTPLEKLDIIFDDSKYQEIVNKNYLLFFGTLNGIKGVDILLQTLPDVLDKYPDISIVLIGPNHCLPSGERAVEWVDNNLKIYKQCGRILYYPPLVKSQLYPIIKHAVGVVLPSRVDNYPNTCIEAMSLGVPVIGTFNSSLDEIIANDKTGFLASNSNSDSLLKSIYKLLSLTEEEKRIMRRNILAEINQILSEDRVGELIKYYESVVKLYKVK